MSKPNTPTCAAAAIVTQNAPQVLKRSITLPMLVLYGLGVTVGAGIYVLIGAAAARAGPHAPIAFLLAGIVMALTAASFAELAGRMPVSAGEAAYVRAGFGSERASLVTGLLVLAAGIISAAAISRGAAGYIGVFVTAQPTIIIAAVVLVMGSIAAWGITEAVALAAIMTLIELSGLVVVIVAGLWHDPAILTRSPEAWSGLSDASAWSGVFGATLLAFFAFIGFEGMVNVAEEVVEPERTIPRAIALTLLISTALYILVVWIAIYSVPRNELAESSAPLSLVFQHVTGASPAIISLIAVFATINGIIAQMVMSSRVIYGLARQGTFPAALATVSPITQTPLIATAIVVALVLVLAVAVPIERLAELTTRVMLVIFGLVNAALVLIKWRGEPANGAVDLPIAVPVAGCASCIALLVADSLR